MPDDAVRTLFLPAPKSDDELTQERAIERARQYAAHRIRADYLKLGIELVERARGDYMADKNPPSYEDFRNVMERVEAKHAALLLEAWFEIFYNIDDEPRKSQEMLYHAETLVPLAYAHGKEFGKHYHHKFMRFFEDYAGMNGCRVDPEFAPCSDKALEIFDKHSEKPPLLPRFQHVIKSAEAAPAQAKPAPLRVQPSLPVKIHAAQNGNGAPAREEPVARKLPAPNGAASSTEWAPGRLSEEEYQNLLRKLQNAGVVAKPDP